MKLPQPLTAEEAGALAVLHGRCFSATDAWSAESFRASLQQPHVIGWCLEPQYPAAFIITQLVAGEAEVLTVAVDPARRREGLARLLLRHALKDSAQRGAERIHLEVAENNAPAIALYLAEGFAQVGKRSGYYPSGQAALLFSRHLKSYC
jgi:ribosomal-protein-alanine N-acetyltransferase